MLDVVTALAKEVSRDPDYHSAHSSIRLVIEQTVQPLHRTYVLERREGQQPEVWPGMAFVNDSRPGCYSGGTSPRSAGSMARSGTGSFGSSSVGISTVGDSVCITLTAA